MTTRMPQLGGAVQGIEMSASYYIVSLSEQALFTIATSALEAYRVSNPKNDEEHEPKETYGNLWGYQATTKRDGCIYHVTLADVDIAAECDSDSAIPLDESFKIKEEFIDKFRPEIEYLGNFHSHPYDLKNDGVRNALRVEREELFSFSDSDYDLAKELMDSRNYRVGIVVTVLETDRRRANKHVGETSFSCIRFSTGQHTVPSNLREAIRS